MRRLQPTRGGISSPSPPLLAVTAGMDLGSVTLVEPAPKTVSEEDLAEPAGDWLCAWCLHRVANDSDRFRYEGRHEFAFTNPEGICFEILTFSPTVGCRKIGKPTLEHTWFPGHAWSYCVCASCSQHLGWHYAGPHDFAGLIRNRIVRGTCIRN